MSFGPQHYVPVLKVKLNEKAALRSISPKLQPRIVPLLEIVERKVDKAPTIDAHLDTAFKNLADSVRGYSRCLLDAREIENDGPAAVAEVFRRASADGIVFTPVTGISRTADVAGALANQTHGIALRLTREEFENGGMAGSLRSFLTQHGLAPEGVDLVVDLGPVDEFIVPGVMALSDAFLAEVPDHPRWRTLTVSACAFPQSMGGVARNSHSFVERADWIAWRDGLHAGRADLARLPTYSDCAIQQPAGVEDFDFRTMQVSASIRYTLEEQWLLIKGESTRVTRPGVQFPALATQLVYGHLQPHFAGPDHCDGCAGAKAAADATKGFGSLGAWRRLGAIHHVSTVMDALASLPWP